MKNSAIRRRATPPPVLIDTTPLSGPLLNIGPVELQPVRRTPEEPLFNSLMEHYHHLAYEQGVGEHVKYVAWAQGRPVAVNGQPVWLVMSKSKRYRFLSGNPIRHPSRMS